MPTVMPRLLLRKHLERLKAEAAISVSLKYDGTRALLVCDRSADPKEMTLVTRAKKPLAALPLTADRNFIADCEVLPGGRVIILDLLSIDNRSITHLPLSQRVAIAEMAVVQFVPDGEVKKYAYNRDELDRLESSNTHPCDGYIVKAESGAAPVFKWKKTQTIDFLLDGDLQPLINYGAAGTKRYRKCRSISRLPPTIMPWTIAECEYDGRSYTFVRVRTDKNRPNYIAVVDDIEDFFKDPIGDIREVFNT